MHRRVFFLLPIVTFVECLHCNYERLFRKTTRKDSTLVVFKFYRLQNTFTFSLISQRYLFLTYCRLYLLLFAVALNIVVALSFAEIRKFLLIPFDFSFLSWAINTRRLFFLSTSKKCHNSCNQRWSCRRSIAADGIWCNNRGNLKWQQKNLTKRLSHAHRT